MGGLPSDPIVKAINGTISSSSDEKMSGGGGSPDVGDGDTKDIGDISHLTLYPRSMTALILAIQEA